MKKHRRILIAADERYQNYAKAVQTADSSAEISFIPAPEVIFPPDVQRVNDTAYEHIYEDAAAGKFDRIAQRYDILLLPGGGDLEPWRYGELNTASRNLEPDRDAWEWLLLDVFVTLKKPVLGVCRGMQSINVYFGGTLLQDIPGHDSVSDGAGGRKDRLHMIHSTGLLGYVCGETCTVNSAHHQAAARMGKQLNVEQRSSDGIAEGFRHDILPVWGVQWHPERLDTEPGYALFRAFLKLC